MVKVIVLKPFLYGGERGTRESTVAVHVGDEIEILDGLLAGLAKEGFVADAKAKPIKQPGLSFETKPSRNRAGG